MKLFRSIPGFLLACGVMTGAALTGCGQAPTVPVTGALSEPASVLPEAQEVALEPQTGYTVQAVAARPAPALRLEALLRQQRLKQVDIMFNAADKNRDGAVSRNEVKPNAEIFKFDKNRDNKVTRLELQAYADAITPAEVADQVKKDLAFADEVLKAVDKNKDRKVSKAEYQAGWKSGFIPVLSKSGGDLRTLDARMVEKLFTTYVSKDGQLDREGVAMIVEDVRFAVQIKFFEATIRLIVNG